ncbi:SepM family pheromone-processing serine protease [Bacillus sp. FJAT-49736]|uniref:SepM family pheromone-processing serine protease n=1 Tax=Bacillus sp. FJAT-49736 TaxID=2833582 RepID=UPI001BC95707|nr:SepM family pheromone-processing serine protease [Bacillus sp. FJAT-49736]MBS4175314.1 PDZ domain-containing protein [Bacillus sp. FJAT-49736]
MNKFLRRKSTFAIFIIGAVLIIGLFIPTPYYLEQPGSVEALSPRVTVENGHKDEKGNLYLTTVLSTKATNVYLYLYGLVAPHTQMEKAVDVKGDMSDEEYNRLLEHMMSSSQQNAIVSGLKAAGEQVTIRNNGVFVYSVLPDSKAKGTIMVGDVIHSVDGHPVKKSMDFINYLYKKKAGDKVTIGWTHDGQNLKKSIELVTLDKKTNRAGIGIVPEDEVTIQPSRKININASDIGGPSAGLMFSLEIYNQLVSGDLTRGYQIAGTGTIDQNGNVGQIGGIRDKIVAAHKAGIDIFFCPADIQKGDTNEKDIKDEARKLGYKIKIVPVKTMTDAVHYLEKLQPKK